MKLPTILKFLLVLMIPFLLFLSILNFYAFDSTFYNEKFSEYKVYQAVPDAVSLHEKVIGFIKGKPGELPDEFNDREKQHLQDVRKIAHEATILLYTLIILFVSLSLVSARMLKTRAAITDFFGNVFLYGGALTLISAAAIYFLLSLNFASTFESFHLLLFEKGTYLFDPAKDIIVRLYPEQLFMALGERIAKGVVMISLILAFLGALLLIKSKRIKRVKINNRA